MKMREKPLIAVMFDHLGPYHAARMTAAAVSGNVVAVEVCAETVDYSWVKTAETNAFKLITLFERGAYDSIRRGDMVTRLREAFDRIKPDVVAVPGWAYLPALEALRWCEMHRIPSIVMSESQEEDRSRSMMLESLKSGIIIGFSAALVGGLRHKAYLQKLGMPPGNIFMGYDVVDNDYFRLGADNARRNADSLRREHGLPEQYILASARFMERKNLKTLVSAYAAYKERTGPSAWSLVLLGDGKQRSDIELLICELGLKQHVLMPGFKQYDDLPVFYGLAQAFVHPSYSEQWGLVVNEAMAAGLPVLVSDRCGCAADLIHDGENGFTFHPRDTSKLAELICNLHGSAELCRKLSSNSLKIIDGWTPSGFASGLQRAVECALKVGPRRVSVFHRVLLSILPSLIPARREVVSVVH